jgi:hypothetical protein
MLIGLINMLPSRFSYYNTLNPIGGQQKNRYKKTGKSRRQFQMKPAKTQATRIGQ